MVVILASKICFGFQQAEGADRCLDMQSCWTDERIADKETVKRQRHKR